MGNRRSQRTVPRQAEPADESQADPARSLVPLDARDQQDVSLGVERPLSAQTTNAADGAPGDDLARYDLDHGTVLRFELQVERRLGNRRKMDGIRVIK